MFKLEKNIPKGIWLNKCGNKIYTQCEIPMDGADKKFKKLNKKLNDKISLNGGDFSNDAKSGSYEAVDQSDSEGEFDLEVVDDENQFDTGTSNGLIDKSDYKLQISH